MMSSDDSDSGSDDLSQSEIIGIVVACFVVAFLAGIALFFYLKWRNQVTKNRNLTASLTGDIATTNPITTSGSESTYKPPVVTATPSGHNSQFDVNDTRKSYGLKEGDFQDVESTSNPMNKA